MTPPRPPILRNVDIGARLRAARLAAGLTQAEVVAHGGGSRALLCRLERGQRGVTADRLERIARACGTTADAVIGAPEPEADLPDEPGAPYVPAVVRWARRGA